MSIELLNFNFNFRELSRAQSRLLFYFIIIVNYENIFTLSISRDRDASLTYRGIGSPSTFSQAYGITRFAIFVH